MSPQMNKERASITVEVRDKLMRLDLKEKTTITHSQHHTPRAKATPPVGG